jgi:hypothetical protein
MSTLGGIIRNILTGGQYPLVDVRSSVDGKTYRVRDLPDKQQAADLMAKVRMRLIRIIEHFQATYPDKPQVRRLMKNFVAEPSRMVEATPDAEHTSYSVNKGETMHLCLRQRRAGDESLVDENVMTFVTLHELGHCMTESIGHGPDFWNNFAWILKEAEAKGIYTHQDFAAQPVPYCGVSITDQPKYDKSQDEEFANAKAVTESFTNGGGRIGQMFYK